MVSQEQSAKRRGGILADDMGLGKTIQTIALMLQKRVSKPPSLPPPDVSSLYSSSSSTSSSSSSPRSASPNLVPFQTLIVGPIGVLDQWKQEILDKTGGAFQVSSATCVIFCFRSSFFSFTLLGLDSKGIGADPPSFLLTFANTAHACIAGIGLPWL